MWEMAAIRLHDDFSRLRKISRVSVSVALLPTSKGWWERLRALEVKCWQGRRLGWDATEGRNGSAVRTAWGNAA